MPKLTIELRSISTKSWIAWFRDITPHRNKKWVARLLDRRCSSARGAPPLSVLAHFRDAVCKKLGELKAGSFTGNWCQFRLTHRQRQWGIELHPCVSCGHPLGSFQIVGWINNGVPYLSLLLAQIIYSGIVI